MTKQEAQQKFNEELIKELKATRLPNSVFEELDERGAKIYSVLRDVVLKNCSIAVLQSQFPLTIDEYTALSEKQKDFTLFETQIINTLIMNRTPNDFRVCNFKYVSALFVAAQVGEKYNEIVQPISEAIKTRLEIMGVQGPWGQRQKLVN